MDAIRKLCAALIHPAGIILFMMTSESTATRTLTIVLPESEWRALRTAEPDAIGWLQAQIRQRLSSDSGSTQAGSTAKAAGSSESYWGHDDY
jgi:hypothetical protein